MKAILIILAVFLFLVAFANSVIFRLIIFHPIATITNAIRDIIQYFKHKEYDYYDAGLLNCLFAHFGGGKTLSAVEIIVSIFNRYNNKYVWDRGRECFVLQKIHIISNVHLNNVPYEELCSLSQIVCCAWRNKELDKKQKTRTVVLVLLDEASAQLNSREFKTNINADFLNSLITSRHFHMSIYYTSQKFKLVDALLRSVTQTCISCHKVWRFMVHEYFNADELEYAPNPTILRPYRRTGFFIFDKSYNAYDTLATVEKLKKSVDKGDMMTDEEILQLRGNLNPDIDMVTPNRKFVRRKKKMR